MGAARVRQTHDSPEPTIMLTKVLELVLSAVDEINKQLPPRSRVPRSETAPLTGGASALDSLAFLTLIVTTEELVGAAFRKPINLAGMLMDADEAHPPRTVGELANLIVFALERKGRA